MVELTIINESFWKVLEGIELINRDYYNPIFKFENRQRN